MPPESRPSAAPPPRGSRRPSAGGSIPAHVPPTPNAHANVGVPSRELGPADDRPSPVIVRFWRRLRHYLVALWSNKTRLRYLVGVIIIGVVPIVVLLLPRVIAEYD